MVDGSARARTISTGTFAACSPSSIRATRISESTSTTEASSRAPTIPGSPAAPFPTRCSAPALDGLYRLDGAFVDYGDLSPRHLGTIYERLLDYRLEAAEGGLFLAPATGRHESGSYYTPDYVVDAIVEATLEPLLAARSEANAGVGLRGQDALDGFLSLRVLDPAMGSGHFLVSAAGYIAQYIATDPSYDGDLPLVEIQRLVAERCLYGVDLNPMAVELARLSLWPDHGAGRRAA